MFSWLHPELQEAFSATEPFSASAFIGQPAEPDTVPLLIKIIRAREALSVQVHPGDEFAREQEEANGKTEMWYVLDAAPEAFLYYGLKHKISPNEFLKRILNLLFRFSVQRSGSFIEDENLRVVNKCTGNGNTLLFPA